ncbi:MAG: sugar nucleotide-binding protein, partial [Candidatus Promineifilaceae bacterium]|nr:sugar nucleotide-binding protein [Candidatus Promineifilaceae bacterium]
EVSVDQLVADIKPEAIIHTIGSNRAADLNQVIVEGTRHVAQAAAKNDVRLIHISTDALFNGEDAPYNEDALPTPLHEYGRAKARAERIVATHDNHVIVRTSLIYGLQVMDHSTAWAVRALDSGQPVTLFTNQRRNPVWVVTLCRAILELASHDFKGIINVAGRQEMTRADFGLRMLNWWQIENRETLSLGPGDGDHWPMDCTLDLRLAAKILSTPLLGVDEVLDNNKIG